MTDSAEWVDGFVTGLFVATNVDIEYNGVEAIDYLEENNDFAGDVIKDEDGRLHVCAPDTDANAVNMPPGWAAIEREDSSIKFERV